jgi:hypothetical protein
MKKYKEAYEITFVSVRLVSPLIFRFLCSPCSIKGEYEISKGERKAVPVLN